MSISDGRLIGATILRSATRQLSHRGPDAEGMIGWDQEGILLKDDKLTDQPLNAALGHRRLSILDLSAAGHQPMRGAKGLWLVFNGEIYNYKEIQKELASYGYEFKTRSDSEVILASYAAWGEECVKRFNGMWAFAIYDPTTRSLFLSRDRLGVKPLYYTIRENIFFFTSEIKVLLDCPGIRPRIRGDRLIHYLIDYKIDNGPETIYQDIMELRGGHCMVVNGRTGRTKIWQFWQLPEDGDLEGDDEKVLDRYSELIEDAVRLRLHADVPVALTLSGGIDSSVICLAARRNGASVQTFTSRFPEYPEIDETSFAVQVARSCQIDPQFIEPSLGEMLAEEPALTRHQEMPYGSLSIYIHWVILAKIRSLGFPVVLSGQGGDECFLGYERYYVSAAWALLPNIFRLIGHMIQTTRHSRLTLKELVGYMLYFSNPSFQRKIRLRRRSGIYHPALISMLPPPQPERFKNIRELQESELLKNTLSTLLRYDDRTSGALGMETRLPFLDFRMVEFAYRLPLKYKIRDGWTKYLSRCYLVRHLPSSVAWRKRKLGFNAPQADWTRSLVEARGKDLESIPFARGLTGEKHFVEGVSLQQQWDIYNVLHLAQLLNWEWAS